jgi:imidazolonepropionase-like amidohydrolase
MKSVSSILLVLCVMSCATTDEPTTPGASPLSVRIPARPAVVNEILDERTLVIRGVNVVDVKEGRSVSGTTVVVRGNRIVSVAEGALLVVPPQATVIDAGGRFLIPGLWDMHVHALDPSRWSWGALLMVANGVTGFRDPATVRPLPEVASIRAGVAAGKIVAPRFVTAGPLLDGPPAIFREFITVDSAESMRTTVKSLQEEGADFIKVYTRLSRDAFTAALDEARKRGLHVAGHVPLSVTTAEASAMGMKSVEHSFRHRLACSANEQEIRAILEEQIRTSSEKNWKRYYELEERTWQLGLSYDEPGCRALGRTFARNGTWFVPTAVEMYSRFRPEVTGHEPFAKLFDDARLQYYPSARVAQWRDEVAQARGKFEGRVESSTDPLATSDRIEAERAAEVKNRLRMTLAIHQGGGGILAGTDASFNFPLVLMGFSLHEELELMVRSGLTPAEALRTATLNPAVFLGIEQTSGTVGEGKVADLVLLNSDPLKQISNTKDIYAVVLNGQYFDRKALDQLLADAKAAANVKSETR